MTDIFTTLGIPPVGAPPPTPAVTLPPEFEAWISQHPADQQAQARATAEAEFAKRAPVVQVAPPVVQPSTPPAPAKTEAPPKEKRGRPTKSEALQIILACAPGTRPVSEIRDLIALLKEEGN